MPQYLHLLLLVLPAPLQAEFVNPYHVLPVTAQLGQALDLLQGDFVVRVQLEQPDVGVQGLLGIFQGGLGQACAARQHVPLLLVHGAGGAHPVIDLQQGIMHLRGLGQALQKG